MPLPSAMASVTEIPFQRIPHQSALFLRYLEFSPAALRYFREPPTIDGLAKTARELIQDPRFARQEITAILRRQNERYGSGAAALAHTEALEDPNCVAVLTGQQVGLFTGPLYTIYKALTAIYIAGRLKESGIRAVPIFWMDTEDHDLPEVTHRTVLDPGSALHSIDYRQALFDDMPARPVGSIQFPEAIVQAVQDYLSRLPDSEWKAGIKYQLETTCRPGSTFAQSFAELLLQIIPDSGLILFDPQDTEAKHLASSLFQTALREENALRAALVRRNEELTSSGFHAQVSILENSTVLFFLENGERRAVERRGSGFALKGTEITFGRDELMEAAARSPEKFSPNVLLRPLVQDLLFPTVAYVGGSAELAYFAQVEVLYDLFRRPMPVIWPRDSFTIIEPHISSEMNRLGIDLEDCFQGKLHMIGKAFRDRGLSGTAGIEELRDRLDRVLTEVKPEMETLESPIAHALETARNKILHNVQRLKSQIIRFEGAHNNSISRAVHEVLNHCYPNQSLQERELDIYHFISRYGSSVLETVRSATTMKSFAHRVIRI